MRVWEAWGMVVVDSSGGKYIMGKWDGWTKFH
jgi:hypothetical protein